MLMKFCYSTGYTSVLSFYGALARPVFLPFARIVQMKAYFSTRRTGVQVSLARAHGLSFDCLHEPDSNRGAGMGFAYFAGHGGFALFHVVIYIHILEWSAINFHSDKLYFSNMHICNLLHLSCTIMMMKVDVG
jgi:hypothetical protein